jgi:uncharacterized peroxidase-related enzyme
MMVKFQCHTIQTAHPASAPLLEMAKAKFGFVPNLLGGLAESPTALKAYLTLGELVATSSLTVKEQNILMLTVSQANDCVYCMSAHTAIAKMAKLDDGDISALCNDRPLADQKSEDLRKFCQAVVHKRGWVSAHEVETFLAAGYTRGALLDVLTVVSMKTLSNYANHILKIPVDPQFAETKWRSTHAE